MCEGVSKDSVHRTWWEAFYSWNVEFHSRLHNLDWNVLLSLVT